MCLLSIWILSLVKYILVTVIHLKFGVSDFLLLIIRISLFWGGSNRDMECQVVFMNKTNLRKTGVLKTEAK